jgi:hypothetical protein
MKSVHNNCEKNKNKVTFNQVKQTDLGAFKRTITTQETIEEPSETSSGIDENTIMDFIITTKKSEGVGVNGGASGCEGLYGKAKDNCSSSDSTSTKNDVGWISISTDNYNKISYDNLKNNVCKDGPSPNMSYLDGYGKPKPSYSCSYKRTEQHGKYSSTHIYALNIKPIKDSQDKYNQVEEDDNSSDDNTTITIRKTYEEELERIRSSRDIRSSCLKIDGKTSENCELSIFL